MVSKMLASKGLAITITQRQLLVCGDNVTPPIGSGLCANEASTVEVVRRYGPRIGFASMLRRLRDVDDNSSGVDEHNEYMWPMFNARLEEA